VKSFWNSIRTTAVVFGSDGIGSSFDRGPQRRPDGPIVRPERLLQPDERDDRGDREDQGEDDEDHERMVPRIGRRALTGSRMIS
jgi:hypothetical protein